MTINIASIKAKLLHISKENNIDFQVILNRFGTEQFLARLSQSEMVSQFVFKGGSLLMYLIETNRKTRDIDFSIKRLSNQVGNLVTIIQSILEVDLDDGIVWDKPVGETLSHPDMQEPGARIMSNFSLDRMRGQIQMDLALGDNVDPVYLMLPRLQYKGVPLFGGNFSILTYPPESIFAEKLHIAVAKKENNSRMKDYYDLLKLCQSSMNHLKLRNCIETTFSNRATQMIDLISFDTSSIEAMQLRWSSFLAKERLKDAPNNISDVIETINKVLRSIT
jgi:predicted nucleotidyltransferase component of viral defense system